MASENRLTEKHYNGKGYYMLCSGVLRCDGKCGDCDELDKLVDRLGEYEDKAEQTVEAVPVVHGRWEDAGFGLVYKCSECGHSEDVRLSNYCPKCGAKMDGGGG